MKTVIESILGGEITTHAGAQRAAERIVESWHQGGIAGELKDALGLDGREYQAWATGGVSLLSIAEWRRGAKPELDPATAWFRISGRPGREKVGYLQREA